MYRGQPDAAQNEQPAKEKKAKKTKKDKRERKERRAARKARKEADRQAGQAGGEGRADQGAHRDSSGSSSGDEEARWACSTRVLLL